MGSPRFPREMWPAKDSFHYTGRLCLTSVLVRLGAPFTDVASEVPLADEFFNFILECNAFFSGVANVLVIPTVLTLVSLRAVSPHCVGSFVDPVCLVAKNTSSRDLVRSVKLLYLLEGGLVTR